MYLNKINLALLKTKYLNKLSFSVGGAFGFSPLDLFKNGEQGVWYDPSDLSTLFQDAAGTTPVTADGDPVGLMLDKSGNDNHATQTVSASRPTYRTGDSRGVVNQLLYTYTFNNTYWFHGDVTVTEDFATAPDGTMTAARVQVTGPNAHLARVSVANNSQWKSIYARTVSGVGDVTLLSYSNQADALVTLTEEWTRIDRQVNTSEKGGNIVYAVDFRSADATLTEVLLWGVQLEEGASPTEYQHNGSHLGGVGTGLSTDLHWLEFDGVDDILFMPAGVASSAAYTVMLGYKKVKDLPDETFPFPKFIRTSDDSQSFHLRKSEGTLSMKASRTSGTDSRPNIGPYDLVAPTGESHVLRAEVTTTESTIAINNNQSSTASNTGTYLASASSSEWELMSEISGGLHGIVMIGKKLSSLDVQNSEVYLASKSGVTL